MIFGELAAGVRILLEKGLSRHHIYEDQQFQGNTQKFLSLPNNKGRKVSVVRSSKII
jgi:hypothetical protein